MSSSSRRSPHCTSMIFNGAGPWLARRWRCPGAIKVDSLCRRRKTSSSRVTSAVPSTTTRSEEHTSELQSLMRISYAVFCLKKKKHIVHHTTTRYQSHDNLIIIRISYYDTRYL